MSFFDNSDLLAGPTQCASGYFSVPATAWGPSCAACAAGSYLRQAGDTVCLQCPAGSFCANRGSTACTSCPAGSFAAGSNATVCTTCTSKCGDGFVAAASCTSTADLVCQAAKISSGVGHRIWRGAAEKALLVQAMTALILIRQIPI